MSVINAPNHEQRAALSGIEELMLSHFAEAEESADEDGKFSISFNLETAGM